MGSLGHYHYEEAEAVGDSNTERPSKGGTDTVVIFVAEMKTLDSFVVFVLHLSVGSYQWALEWAPEWVVECVETVVHLTRIEYPDDRCFVSCILRLLRTL